MIHVLYFDGTSYFVEDESYETQFADKDTFVIKRSYDFDKLCLLADQLNEELYL